MNEQQFVQLLEGLMQPDTDRVKAATATLNKDYYSSPASLSALLHILITNQSQQLRQLAAVEARKLVPKHWPSLPSEQKPQIRNQLLQFTLAEQAPIVRHASARVIASIAKIDLEDGEWTDLPSFLKQCALEQDVRHREVGVYIIYTLIETVGDLFTDNTADLLALFSKTVQDPQSIDVRINTMLALSRLAMALDTDEDPKATKAFQETIPAMVATLKQAVDANDSDNAQQAFEVFQTLLGCDTALLNKHFGDLLQFMMEMAISKDKLDDEFRTQALSFLMQSVRFRKLKVQGLRIGEQLAVKSLQIVTELEYGSDDDDEDDITPARSALGLLDILAGSLPPSQVVVPLLKAIGPYVTSQDPAQRRAGILSLGMTVEGAPDFIATQLNEILPMVLHLLEDPDVSVRDAALSGLTRLADDLAEDIGKEHAKIIPVLVRNFDAAMPNIQGANSKQSLDIVRGCCNAIDSMIEGLEKEDAAKYVSDLVPRISPLFSYPDLKVKVAVIGAVGSLASAAQEAFMPYFEQTMHALAQYVTIKDSQDELDLRGVVCDAMGKIASAVGAQAFQPYVQPLMQASEEALHLDHPRLKETSYVLWSTMAKVYGAEFDPYLSGIVKALHDSLNQDETDLEVALGEEAKDLVGGEVTIAGKKVKITSAELKDNDGEDDDDDDDIIDIDAEDGDDWDDLDAVTAVALEKEIAVEVIGDVVAHVKDKYLPYFPETVKIIGENVEHSYEGVRKSAVSTLWRMYTVLYGIAEDKGMEKWEPGLPLKHSITEEVKQLGEYAMNATLSIWPEELDRSTLTDINRAVGASLKLCGPAPLAKADGTYAITQICNIALEIITKKHPCQQDLGDEEGDDPALDESSEYDWLVIDTAFDLVTCVSAVLGEQFGEVWKMFEKPIMKYASSQEAVERVSAVGCIAECVGNMGSAVTPYSSNLFKMFIRRLSDEDPEAKSNAVYGVGLLCEHSQDQQEVLSNYNTVLGKLEPLLHDKQEARLLDNSAGCVSRMIKRFPDRVPVADVLPRLIELLPLKEGYEENAPVYSMIVALYQAGNPTMRQLTPQLMPVLQQVIGEPTEQLDDETRQQVAELIKYLQSHK